jgi:hypothetical protein
MGELPDKVLACGCIWTPANSLRCGICDRCAAHCTCATDGTRKVVSGFIKSAVRSLDRVLEQADWVDDSGSAAEALLWRETRRWTAEDQERLRALREKRESRQKNKKEA